jgi:hypothetical protein
VSMRECVRAVASVIVIRLHNWVYNNDNNSEMEEKSYPIILSVYTTSVSTVLLRPHPYYGRHEHTLSLS